MALDLRVAWAQHIGTRCRQEDAARVTQWPNGFTLIVLADGMGGAPGGEVASQIVVDAFREYFLRMDGNPSLRDALHGALATANQSVRSFLNSHPAMEGMGATLVAVAFDGIAMDWLSVGDSSLLLWRHGRLEKLNVAHSFAEMRRRGLISYSAEWSGLDEESQSSQLLSAVMGTEIPFIDSPNEPTRLLPEDRILVASDGLDPLCLSVVAKTLMFMQSSPENDVAERLIDAVVQLGRSGMDNTTVAVATVVQAP